MYWGLLSATLWFPLNLAEYCRKPSDRRKACPNSTEETEPAKVLCLSFFFYHYYYY